MIMEFKLVDGAQFLSFITKHYSSCILHVRYIKHVRYIIHYSHCGKHALSLPRNVDMLT